MKRILILALSLVFITACSNSDDNPKIDAQLNGTWMLTNISCFCGFDPNTSFNDFTLNFKNSENSVNVQNPREDYFYIATSGTYDYTLSDDSIKINGSDDFKYSIDGDKLTMTRIDDPQIADDELVLSYKKVQ
ncbi:hypothetical protein [Gillisia sp. CAL575]|uniref:hypothetical protein n=1 Tax=Gillisia sp. CAL575 TaxID=985255 RepID=UPI0003A7A60C|nr:hypothetical protein [Gillisia sp. CAL575]